MSEYETDTDLPEMEGAEGEAMPNGAMDEEQFRSIVSGVISDASDYIDGWVAPRRAKALEYYRGQPFGWEEEGRSQIVMTEVRDVVQAIIPGLLRIFTQSDQVVEFAPRTAQSVEAAAQATDYTNFVFQVDNPGFSILHSVFKDALVSKIGIVKWRWAQDTQIEEANYTGLDQSQATLLQQEPDLEVVEYRETVTQQAVVDPQTGAVISPPVVSIDMVVKRRKPKDRLVVEAVPPEEFIVSRTARDLDTADYVGHRSLKTASELVAMGYDPEEIEEHGGSEGVFPLNYEAQTRNPASQWFTQDNGDKTMRRILYIESYIRIDKDGDGIAELRRVCTIGNGHYVLHDEIATDVPFATFCPDPEPHMVIGQSIADQTMDLQEIKSAVVRNTMDSLAQVIHPRTVVVEGQVNLDDVMNTEVGAIIRARAPGMVASLTEPFVGQNAMPIIAYLDQVRAQRTGISAASQGLDPDVLQSTTKAAVTATVSGAQERIELIARLFAENGLRRMFAGILKALVRHQDKPRVVRLRQQWVEVDPRYWDAEMDVIVHVGLGRGTEQDKLQFLMLVAQKQEQIMQLLGPNNPMVNLSQYQQTLSRICALAGFKDGGTFFSPVDPQMLQQMANAPKPPDPNTMLVQVEAQKVQASVARDNQQLDLDRQKILMEDARERENTHIDALVKLKEIEAKYGAQVNAAEIENVIYRDQEIVKAQIAADTARQNAAMQEAIKQMQAQAQAQMQPGQGMTGNA